jgi:hypothetical protein
MESIIIEFFKQLNTAVKNYHFDTQESIKFETLFEISTPLVCVLADFPGFQLKFHVKNHRFD